MAGRKLGTKNPSSLRIKKNKELFLLEFSKSFKIIQSCKIAGFVRSTYYHYYEIDADFRSKVDELRESLIDDVESELIKLCKSGNFNAIKYFLSCKAKERNYSDDAVKLQLPEEQIKITYVVPSGETADLMADVWKKYGDTSEEPAFAIQVKK